MTAVRMDGRRYGWSTNSVHDGDRRRGTGRDRKPPMSGAIVTPAVNEGLK